MFLFLCVGIFFGDGLSAQALIRSWALDVFLPSLPFVCSVCFFCFLRPFRQYLAGEGPCGGWGGPWPTYTYLDNPNMSPKWSGMVPGPKPARACPGRFWSWDHPGPFWWVRHNMMTKTGQTMPWPVLVLGPSRTILVGTPPYEDQIRAEHALAGFGPGYSHVSRSTWVARSRLQVHLGCTVPLQLPWPK